MSENTKTYKDTYYFSHACDTTVLNPLTGHRIPSITTNPFFMLTSYEMGRYTNDENVDSKWWPNDGCVNTISSQYPFGHPHKEVTDADMSFNPGIWNYFPAKVGFDHMDIVGIHSKLKVMYDIMPFFKEIAGRMVDTEKAVLKSVKKAETHEVHEKTTTKAKVSHKAEKK